MFKLVVCVTLLLGFILNFYKFKIFYDLRGTGKPYEGFPWAKNKVTSRSDPHWLLIHLLTAFVNVFLTAYMILKDQTNDQHFITLHNIVNSIFIVTILFNIWNFGETSPFVSTIVNGLPLLISIIALLSEWQYRMEVYFMAITAPITFEALMLVRQLLF